MTPAASPRLPAGRDHELLRFIARHRFVSAEQARARFGGTLRVYERLRLLHEHGLVRKTRVVVGGASIYMATASGLRVARQNGPVLELSVARHLHHGAVVWLAIALEEEFGPERVLTERELHSRGGGPFWVVLPGRRQRRFPDLAVVNADGTPSLFVEVADHHVDHPEYRARLEASMAAYVRAPHVAGARYYATTPVAQKLLAAARERVDGAANVIDLRELALPGTAPAGAGRRAQPRQALLTGRDVDIVRWVGRQQLATAEQVAAHLGSSLLVSRTRLRSLSDNGLLHRDRLAWRSAYIYRASERGLELAELPLSVAELDLASYWHALDLTDLCLALEREFGAARVFTERELRRAERCEEDARFTVAAGSRRHYPDLAVARFDVSGRTLAVELERSVKTRHQLDVIVAAYVAARHVAGVRYYVSSDAVERAVRAAIERGGAPDGLFELRPRSGSAAAVAS